MVSISNTLLGIVNAISLIISLVILCLGFYVMVHHGSDCRRDLQNPFLIIGAFLLLVSLFGMVGSFCRVKAFMYVYLIVMFLLILFFIFFTVFVIFITNEEAGKVVSEKGFKEYRLGDYSHWLQKYVINDKNWNDIRSCLMDAQICRSLGHDVNHSATRFYKNNMSPTQSGCCKPPSICGFKFENATFWEVPKSGVAMEDSDCTTWSNDQSKLCYNCKSCKAGILANIRKQWRQLAIINISLLIFIIILYSIGCCAKNTSKSDYSKYKRHRNYA